MKKFIWLIALLLVSGLAMSQSNFSNSSSYMKTYRLGTVISHKAYAAGQIDTTQVFHPWQFTSNIVSIQSLDSASIFIGVQACADSGAPNWSLTTTLDSLSTGSNTGDYKELLIPASYATAYSLRFIFTTNTFRCGTSSPTYSARLTNKRF